MNIADVVRMDVGGDEIVQHRAGAVAQSIPRHQLAGAQTVLSHGNILASPAINDNSCPIWPDNQGGIAAPGVDVVDIEGPWCPLGEHCRCCFSGHYRHICVGNVLSLINSRSLLMLSVVRVS